MGSFKQVLEEMEMLGEMLDSPWQLTDITHNPENIEYVRNAKADGYSDIRFYRVQDDNGTVIFGFKNNAWEIHHMNKNDESDIMTNETDMATGFAATMFSMAKPKVDAGDTVRIVMTQAFRDHYLRLVNLVAKRYGWSVGKEYTHIHQGERVTAIDVWK